MSKVPPFWDRPGENDESKYDTRYLNLRDQEGCKDVRDFVDELWPRYAPFCGDREFLAEARQNNFNAFTWQMYLGVSLLEAGHTLEKAAPEGPDHKVLVEGRRVWVECIAPEPGHGDNEAKRTYGMEMKPGEDYCGPYRPPPDDKIALRITAAIWEKTLQHRTWVKNGIVSADEAYIIAIGAGAIPDVDLEVFVPRIARVVYGLGELGWSYELYSDKPVQVVPTYQSAIARPGKQDVTLRCFLDGDIPEVSAIVFCPHAVWDPARAIGRNLVTVYNATAKNRLPPGTIPLGREYWTTDVLMTHDHRKELPEPDTDPELKELVEEFRRQAEALVGAETQSSDEEAEQ